MKIKKLRRVRVRRAGGRRSVPRAVVAGGAAAILLAGGLGTMKAWPQDETSPVKVPVTVVQTAGSTNEVDIMWPRAQTEVLVGAAEGNATLYWVTGDGTAVSTVVEDLTPRNKDGEEIRPPRTRKKMITDYQVRLAERMNEADSNGSSRSLLAALQTAGRSTHGPVIAFSTGLDTADPLDMRDLEFDVPVTEIVAELTRADEIPALDGRQVTLMLIPVAGDQAPLRQPQHDWLANLWTAILTAGGATQVEVVTGQVGPVGTSGTSQTVPVPPAPGTLTTKRTVEDQPGQRTVTCTLATPVLFAPDSALLLDPDTARVVLAGCIGNPSRVQSVLVEGHTACRGTADSVPTYAKKLSLNRAEAAATIIIDLGVDRALVTTQGHGNTKPLIEPCTDPGNRAVQVTTVISN